MNKVFNLKRHMKRQAFYEGSRGYMDDETRAWMNAYREKISNGMNPQDAWESCRDEYQEPKVKSGKWTLDYASAIENGAVPIPEPRTPAAAKIKSS